MPQLTLAPVTGSTGWKGLRDAHVPARDRFRDLELAEDAYHKYVSVF
jgi:hypothetical protein